MRQFPISTASPRDRLAVALDFPSAALALECIDRLEGSCLWMKVGLELYCATGNSFIELLRGRGLNVFLDLKLHDIPNTVAGAVRSIADVGASLLTLHAAGGEEMMRAAVEVASTLPNCPDLVAVTVLTSMDATRMGTVGVQDAPANQVLRLAQLASRCGIQNLVCSAEETRLLRQQLGVTPGLIVPGIRPIGTDRGDQCRTASPSEAFANGASMIVVGRPITRASSPAVVARTILAEMATASAQN